MQGKEEAAHQLAQHLLVMREAVLDQHQDSLHRFHMGESGWRIGAEAMGRSMHGTGAQHCEALGGAVHTSLPSCSARLRSDVIKNMPLTAKLSLMTITPPCASRSASRSDIAPSF